MSKKCKLAASICGRGCISPKKTCRIKANPDTAANINSLTDKIKAAAPKENKPTSSETVLKDYQSFEDAAERTPFDLARVQPIMERYPELNKMQALAAAQWAQGEQYFLFNRQLVEGKEGPALLKSLSEAIDILPKFKLGANRPSVLKPFKSESRNPPKPIDNDILNRFMSLDAKGLLEMTPESLFKGFSAFSHGSPDDNFFASRSNVRIVLKANANSKGALMDTVKTSVREDEVLFKPNTKVTVFSVQVGDNVYKTIAQAKKDPNFLVSSISINAAED
jgi:hypothetical protein